MQHATTLSLPPQPMVRASASACIEPFIQLLSSTPTSYPQTIPPLTFPTELEGQHSIDMEAKEEKRINAFDDAINELSDLYGNNKLNECIEKAFMVLVEIKLPMHHQVKALTILAPAVPGYEEAERHRRDAEVSYRHLKAL